MKRTASRGLSRRIAYRTMAFFLVLGVLLATVELMVHRQYASLSGELEVRIEYLGTLRDTERAFQESVSYLRAYAAYGRNDLRDQAASSRTEYDELFVKLREVRSGAANEGTQDINDLEGLNTSFDSYSMQAMRWIAEGNRNELAKLSAAQGSSLVRQMEAEFSSLVEQQQKKIVGLTERIRALGRLMLIVPALALLIALGAALLLIGYLKKAFIAPVVAAESAVGRIDRGELVDLGDHVRRDDEIGRLLGGIGKMADGIRSRQLELENNLLQMEEQREELEAQNDELEAQNEQILHQRKELEQTLQRLTHRESQLEAINAYQQSLVGLTDLNDFLQQAIGQLLLVTERDAAMLVMRGGSQGASQADEARWSEDIRSRFGEEGYEVLYSSGYPLEALERFSGEPSGPALQTMLANRPLTRRRPVSGAEAGAHGAYTTAIDAYYPVYNGEGEERPAGFLLLTTYGDRPSLEGEEEVADGMVRQFLGALFAQLTQSERQRQGLELERLNRELEKEKRNLKDQRDATQQVIDSIYEALIVCAPSGEILMCNKVTEELLDPAFKAGVNFVDAIHEVNQHYGITNDAGSRIREALDNGFNGTKMRYTFEPPGRKSRYFEIYVQRIEDVIWGDVRLFVLRDRTDEEETNRLRDEFVSVVSHELRTPLASILGFAEIMLHRSVKPERAQKYLSTIHGEATRLSGLIGDFLDLQRIEAGKQTYRMLPLDLKELTRDVAAQWDGRSGHAVRLNLPEGLCAVRSDGDRLKQVLHNLLSNAIKYSPGQTFVDCSIRREPADSSKAADAQMSNRTSHPQAGHWIVEIRDYGLGIPEEAKSKLFGKFYRVDNSDRRQIGGTGLGLAIVKEMVEGLGGEISFDSVLGEGSTFRFALPELPLSSPAGSVLILEDDVNLGRLIEDSFSSEGQSVCLFTEAESALLALEASAQSGVPKLCIVDLSLAGDLNGWAFIRRLAAEEALRQVPIIVSSALDPPDGYADTEAEKYLRKPFSVRELLEVGRQLMDKSSASFSLALPVPSESLARAALQTHGLDAQQIEVGPDFSIIEVRTDE
ncbi:hypothetical protein B9G55_11320 [Saccharibacillus sp. O16]|nr:hypothetical protein B9G55_11320 [Saccharibacillus sp. O16]